MFHNEMCRGFYTDLDCFGACFLDILVILGYVLFFLIFILLAYCFISDYFKNKK